ETEQPYEEPISVYVYTHVVRPAYRDVVSEYRTDTMFQQNSEPGVFRSGNIELLTKEIREQLDRQFAVTSEALSAPKKSYETFDHEGYDEDEDFADYDEEDDADYDEDNDGN